MYHKSVGILQAPSRSSSVDAALLIHPCRSSPVDPAQLVQPCWSSPVGPALLFQPSRSSPVDPAQLIQPSRSSQHMCQWELYYSIITKLSTVKFLGVSLDENLTFNAQVIKVTTKVSKSVGVMRRLYCRLVCSRLQTSCLSCTILWCIPILLIG